jgi:hypothetical protein
MEVEPDLESLPGVDWEDDNIEDPWEAAFPKSNMNRTGNRRRKNVNASSSGRGTSSTSTAAALIPDVQNIDEANFYTQIADKQWMCNECSR